MEAVIYDEYGADAIPTSGTPEEVLDIYRFYKDIYPGRSLGLTSKDFNNFRKKSND